MTALDDAFGPREKREVDWDALAKHTRFHDAPENVRVVLDEFFTTLGGNPEGKARKAHVAAAREFVAEVGERPDLVKPAIEHNLREGLGVASLRSLIASARILKYKAKNTPFDMLFGTDEAASAARRRKYGIPDEP